MSYKTWRECFATSYRWAIAGVVGAAYSGFDIPSPSAFLNNPIPGIAVIGYLVLALLMLVIMGAVLERLVSRHIAPDEKRTTAES